MSPRGEAHLGYVLPTAAEYSVEDKSAEAWRRIAAELPFGLAGTPSSIRSTRASESDAVPTADSAGKFRQEQVRKGLVPHRSKARLRPSQHAFKSRPLQEEPVSASKANLARCAPPSRIKLWLGMRLRASTFVLRYVDITE